MAQESLSIESLTPEMEGEITKMNARNLVSFYAEELKAMDRRRLTKALPEGVIRHLRRLGVLSARRTYRKGKVLYLTEMGEEMLSEVSP